MIDESGASRSLSSEQDMAKRTSSRDRHIKSKRAMRGPLLAETRSREQSKGLRNLSQ